MPAEHRLRITGRSGSHFTRFAAMFAHELRLPFELDVVPDLSSLDPAAYGGRSTTCRRYGTSRSSR